MWQVIWEAIIEEFSDVPDMESAIRIVFRLLIAGILGGLLGYERERRGKSAGIRTHMLVSVGAALFIVVSQQSGVSPDDMTRVIQGVLQGIGFLGAGAIIIGTIKERSRGLTTAANIWAAAGIGVSAGLGLGATAVLSTFVILFILLVIPLFFPKMYKETNNKD